MKLKAGDRVKWRPRIGYDNPWRGVVACAFGAWAHVKVNGTSITVSVKQDELEITE